MKLNKPQKEVIVKKVIKQLLKQEENLLKTLDDNPAFDKFINKDEKCRILKVFYETERNFVLKLNDKFAKAGLERPYEIKYQFEKGGYNAKGTWVKDDLLKIRIEKLKYDFLKIVPIKESELEEEIMDELILNDSKDIETLIENLVEKFKI